MRMGLFFRYLGLLALSLAFISAKTGAAAATVAFSQSSETVDACDYIEVVVRVEKPDTGNPFIDTTISGSFSKSGGSERKAVDGFCDSADGTVFRIRFMPIAPGDYSYSVTWRHGAAASTHSGIFKATAGHRKGLLRVDPEYSWHFMWEETGEHYFFNGTTAFWLMGWEDDRTVNNSIDRLKQLKINRLRVLMAGAANILWGEPVMTGGNFTLMLRPWLAAAPNSFDQPKIDYTRFNVA